MTLHRAATSLFSAVHHPLLFGGELFAVTEMLRNGIAIYGNRAFLCMVLSLSLSS